MFQTLPAITEAGYTGYGTTEGSVGLLFIQPNGTNSSFLSSFAPLFELANAEGVEGLVGSMDFPTWIEYCNTFLQDPNIATNIQDASRLLTAEIMTSKTPELIDLMLEYPKNPAGFNFSKYHVLASYLLTVRRLV
jgi:hypothetical protein